MEKKACTTMTVAEMGHMLGLKKTDSYYLVHKHFFETVEIGGKMRIVIDSFENWYAGQTKYCKVDGPEPGALLTAQSYSIKDISRMLSISESSAYDLVNHKHLRTVSANGVKRIPKEEFERWYTSQAHYRNEEDRVHDKELEDASFSIPDIASMLGVRRDAVYNLLRVHPEYFDIVVIAGHKRVTKDSFEAWYAKQSRFKKTSDLPPEEQKEFRLQNEIKKAPRLEVDPDKLSYSVKEAAILLDLPEKDVYLLIRGGDLEVRRIGRTIRISRDDINWFLVQQRKYKDSI